MSIASVSSTNGVPLLVSSVQQAAVGSAPAANVPATTSPAVINDVSASNLAGQAGTSQADVQSDVNGINALIQGFDSIDWSKLVGVSAEQIAKGKQYDMARFEAAEGATVAFAGEAGVTGVSFNFDALDAGSIGASAGQSVEAGVSQTNIGSSKASPSSPAAGSGMPETTSAGTSTASAADIALSILTSSAQQPASSTGDLLTPGQNRDFYA